MFIPLNLMPSLTPRMLLKVDIEKPYDSIEWNIVLATLTLMNFPKIWISWIKACITSPIFFFSCQWSTLKLDSYPKRLKTRGSYLYLPVHAGFLESYCHVEFWSQKYHDSWFWYEIINSGQLIISTTWCLWMTWLLLQGLLDLLPSIASFV